MDANEQAQLSNLHSQLFGVEPSSITPLKEQASARKTFRLAQAKRTVVGVINHNLMENRAFVGFGKHFRALSLAVPEILIVSADESAYLTEDLGDICLLDLLEKERKDSSDFPEQSQIYYRKALDDLIQFQTRAGTGLDLLLCYQGKDFDAEAMRADLALFRDQFLKPSGVAMQEQALSADFETLLAALTQAQSGYFLYRDFQARNILVKDEKLFYIDYQSGRIGPAQYDVASLLYQSKANLPEEMRASLLEYYLGELTKSSAFDRNNFLKLFPCFVVLRLAQALGAYGRAGFGHGKDYFLMSIPYAVASLDREIAKLASLDLPELQRCISLAAALFK